eukprot:gene9102-10747_t
MSSGYTVGALADQVTTLPGALGPLKSKQFSGYLDISETKALHYMYFESEGNPATDSVIFWTNGGPGCSGLLGLYTEFGPWRAGSNLTLIRNPFTWVKHANIVFLEQPVGVGFSYSTETISRTGYNDFEASKDNLLAIKAFFRKYPKRASNTFYLASESYGGHYIPQWTLQVLGDKETRKHFKGYLLGNPYTSYASGSTAMANTLWGLQLVPKPLWVAFTELECDSLFTSVYDLARHTPECFDILDVLESYIDTLNPYALEFPVCTISSSTDDTNTTTTTTASPHSQYQSLHNESPAGATQAHYSTLSPQATMLLKLSKRARNNVAYQQYKAQTIELSNRDTITTAMHSETDTLGAHELSNHYSQFRYQPNEDVPRVDRRKTAVKPDKRARVLSEENDFVYDPCAQQYLVDYLNDPAVQAALHVSTTPTPQAFASTVGTDKSSTSPDTAEDNSPYEVVPSTRRWDFCSDAVNEHWAENDLFADTTELYKLIYTHKHKPKDFKMLVFSGDIDGVCATIGTQHWIYNVTSRAPTTLYQTWTYTDTAYGEQLGGYLTTFADSFSFLTIRYAGHEVPAYQPQKALHMLKMFLDGSMFDKSSSSKGKNTNDGDNKDTSSVGTDGSSDSKANALSLVMSVLLSVVALLGLTVCFRKQLIVFTSRT